MKFTVLSILTLTTAVLTAPVPAAEAEASPGYGKYSGYGSYAPPKGGYGKYSGYGSYPRVEDKVAKRDYADYGDYPPPTGGYSSYGDYDGTTPAAYGNYPEPAGGYSSYGTYKRALVGFVKTFFH